MGALQASPPRPESLKMVQLIGYAGGRFLANFKRIFSRSLSLLSYINVRMLCRKANATNSEENDPAFDLGLRAVDVCR